MRGTRNRTLERKKGMRILEISRGKLTFWRERRKGEFLKGAKEPELGVVLSHISGSEKDPRMSFFQLTLNGIESRPGDWVE